MIIHNNTKSLRTKILLIGLMAIVSLSLAACGNLKVRAGVRPAVSALDGLTVGESTAVEVELALGPPFGRGRSLLPFQDATTDLWSYYYEEGTMEDDRRTFLFVYMNEEILDGYMWFSSLPDANTP